MYTLQTSCANNSNARTCGIQWTNFKENDFRINLQAPATTVDKYTTRITTIVPLCTQKHESENTKVAWALFGDIRKFASLSKERFKTVKCNPDTGGILFDISGNHFSSILFHLPVNILYHNFRWQSGLHKNCVLMVVFRFV